MREVIVTVTTKDGEVLDQRFMVVGKDKTIWVGSSENDDILPSPLSLESVNIGKE